MFNLDLNIQQLHDEYAIDQRIRIDNFLEDEVAAELRELCRKTVPFDFIYIDNNTNHVVSPDKMAALTPEEHRDLQIRLNRQASEGIGFLYGGYRLGKERQVIPADLELVKKVYEFFNSRPLLDFVEHVTEATDVVDADAQLTRYTPGNFLTRHSDNIAAEARKIAYVYSFTERWHPDWGGLLQFYANDGTPRDAWIPGSNTLTMFDVRHIHGVSYVAPFAMAPRLSMTGWFRGVKPGR